MRSGISIVVTASDRARLEALVAARGSPQKHVWRARIVLLTDDGLGTVAIMAATGKSKTCVWRWQERFMAEGVDSLLRDRTRPPGIAPLALSLVDRVVALTLEPPGHEATHWTVRAMAKAVGIAASSVVKIWHDHGLAPHRWRSFKLSNDRAFAEKLHDVVGLYVSPPAHAIVSSVDEKSQIQALDRTQPGLPLKRGRGATMTHDYKRNGTTTLFAALNVLDGSVIGRNMQRHRHQEFIRFLNAVEAELPQDKAVHVILDNYATHKQPKVRAWLDRHPRWTFHFVPTSCSWLNAIEGFFAKLTRRRLKNGVFHSVVDLQAAVNRFIKEHNQQPRPFVWRADPDDIIAAVRRGHQTLESIHYVSAVLLRAGAQVLDSASIDGCREVLSAARGIDAAVLDFDLSSADTHALLEQLVRQALPYLFVRARSSCDGTTLMRGRLCFTWPFAGFQVCEALADILDSDRPRPA